MAAFQEIFKKNYNARTKLEAAISNIHSDINITIDKQDKEVKIERLAIKSSVYLCTPPLVCLRRVRTLIWSETKIHRSCIHHIIQNQDCI